MPKTVKLECQTHGVREFTPEHAARLLAIPEKVRGGWKQYVEPDAEKKPNDNTGRDTKEDRPKGKRGRTAKSD